MERLQIASRLVPCRLGQTRRGGLDYHMSILCKKLDFNNAILCN